MKTHVYFLKFKNKFTGDTFLEPMVAIKVDNSVNFQSEAAKMLFFLQENFNSVDSGNIAELELFDSVDEAIENFDKYSS